ncbi:hypothetical protein QAD02_013231 [Eretmocerus hayati]|uniref:Uncharacterized protein n=1 Tax=Eretmocerus hayati TaxID=131215 RepID=A0ACC2P2A9_9HYME|nr:hypothetical protein QAD02_013231 [Eretmocerus hayati]
MCKMDEVGEGHDLPTLDSARESLDQARKNFLNNNEHCDAVKEFCGSDLDSKFGPNREVMSKSYDEWEKDICHATSLEERRMALKKKKKLETSQNTAQLEAGCVDHSCDISGDQNLEFTCQREEYDSIDSENGCGDKNDSEASKQVASKESKRSVLDIEQEISKENPELSGRDI